MGRGCHSYVKKPEAKNNAINHPPFITIFIDGIYKPFPVMNGLLISVLPTLFSVSVEVIDSRMVVSGD